MKRLLALLALLLAAPLAAQPVSVRDSFRVGSGGSVLCTAQSLTADAALTDMFDRGYALVCRDAAVPVGWLYVLRDRGGDEPMNRLRERRRDRAACSSRSDVAIEGLGDVPTVLCTWHGADGLPYIAYEYRRNGRFYVAEGLGGYESALALGLRSLVADREVAGELGIATTLAGDPATFARVQAGVLDPQRALAEAYRRNNAGSYAEASEYFGALSDREGTPAARAEALANEALQKSNLGRHGEAEALFAAASELGGTEPVTARRLRNYRAMHLLNQGLAEEATAELDRPMPPIATDTALRTLTIDRPLAGRLSAETPGASRLRGPEGLTDEDKARILDGQALYLRGTILRLRGRDPDAAQPFAEALDQLVAIRGGRIAATLWLRAQILGELASIAEARGDRAEADRLHGEAILLLETNYPGSSALDAAQARRAGYFARTGRTDEALAAFRAIVAANEGGGDASPGLRRALEPYFALLAERGTDPAAVADLFAASQILVRPGVAQTQAVLARELSGGSDEAARLFRQSVNLTRDIERARVEAARLEGAAEQNAATTARIAELRASLAGWERDQVATQAQLAQFPRYRAVAGGTLPLAELQALLAPGEVYYKMVVVGDGAYALLATQGTARAFRIAIAPAELERQVDALRASISVVENNQTVTYPFDLDRAFALYQGLFGPVAAEVAAASHLIFEPDGAMMRLPANLLVMDEAGVAAYRVRAARPNDDGFDFTGVQWLGRDRDISTAVSARAFRDVRRAPPSRARAEYIGFGQNAPARGFFLPRASGTRGAAALDEGCRWSLGVWNRPISARELISAGAAISGGRPGEAEIVTGADFTDTGIAARGDLANYRILHFATHGLAQPPRPECPTRPSLLTSFGGEGSDGLLSFTEIFDLRIDADLIILSACDTASGAGTGTNAEAGLGGGGEFALDGLVRAFVGAGGRMVIASHWPVPDDFDATGRLITGLFSAPPGTGTAGALRRAQRALMDDPATSHPFYWSAFAVVGDGAAPVIRPAPPRVAAAH